MTLTTPNQDGFYFPAEFSLQKEVWMAWPMREDNWRLNGAPAQSVFALVANEIQKVTQVTMVVKPGQAMLASQQLNENIHIVEMDYNDAWMRDIGPTILCNKQGEKRAVSWLFNAWGGSVDGLYHPWDADEKLASQVAEQLKIPCYHAPFVLEGGAIHTDGEGTVYTTEECLLSEGRNPQLNKDDIEDYLHEYLGTKKVIWLPKGLFNDETNGHIDNLIHVVAPAQVVLAWTDDKDDPQYEISRQALSALQKQKDANGRSIKVIKLPIPGPLFLNEDEANGIKPSKGMKRQAGERLGASYTNFLICNNTIFIPLLDENTDQITINILNKELPDYKVIGISTREVLLGGGNIHCITQQIPA